MLHDDSPRHRQILYVVALGYLIFGDVPDAAVVLGAAVVIASGLFLLWREQRKTR